MKKTNPKFRKMVYNLLGITLLYTLCFCYGRHVEFLASNTNGQFRYSEVISEAAKNYNLHPALIMAVIQAESNFNPKAVSYAGARGLMQINGPTQRYLRLKNAYDPKQNIIAGSKYLRELLDTFSGDVKLALAAYNAGPNAVVRHDGVPPYRETREYVKKVLAYYKHYRQVFFSETLLS